MNNILNNQDDEKNELCIVRFLDENKVEILYSNNIPHSAINTGKIIHNMKEFLVGSQDHVTQ